MGIDLGVLAGGPFADIIRTMAERCVADSRIHACWVGGSLALGNGDEFSDIDFRIAVAPGTVEAWSNPDWSRYLPAARAGGIILRFGDKTLLHHMVLHDGTIVDFLVLEEDAEQLEPAVALLFARTEDLRTRLEGFATPAASLESAINGEEIERLLVDYWIASHKQMKALARRYDESSFVGLYVERMMLLRTLFAEATGNGIDARISLHMLGTLHKGLADRLSPHQNAILGMPTGSVRETIAAIEAVRTEMARAGRVLAERYDVAYPLALEEVVLHHWKEHIERAADRS